MPQKPAFLALLVVTAASALACVPKQGRLESNRFQHQQYPYAVFYADEGHPEAPFGPGWQVENFALEQGRRYAPKVTAEYTVRQTYDLNGDGRGDFERVEALYDLLLVKGSDA